MYKLLTHTDLDGVSCAVLAKLAWGENVDVTFCHNPADVTQYLLKKYNEKVWLEYGMIYVTDLSFDADILRDCKIYKDILRLFDHHGTAVEPFRPYFKWATVEVEKDGRLTCGTELFYQYLLKKGLVGNRDFFVEQVRLFDTWDWYKGRSKLPKYLSNIVLKLGLQYFLRTFTERLRSRDVNELNVFNQYERDILLYDEDREKKDVGSFLKQTYICDVESEDICPDETQFKVGIVFNSSFYSSVLGNDMCRDLGVDIAFMVNLNRGRVEVRTAREDIDIGSLMQTFYAGGGHRKAAGGVLDITEYVIKKCLGRIGSVKKIEQVK